MSDDFLNIHAKLDKIGSDIQEIRVQDVIQNEHLAQHIRRTEVLEKRVDPLEKAFIGFRAVLALIAFAVTIPHIERLAKWLFSSFF